MSNVRYPLDRNRFLVPAPAEAILVCVGRGVGISTTPLPSRVTQFIKIGGLGVQPAGHWLPRPSANAYLKSKSVSGTVEFVSAFETDVHIGLAVFISKVEQRIMATQDGRATTLPDFGVDPNVAARGHAPSLYPRERFVRCDSCGVTVPYAMNAEGPIRRALSEFDSISCRRYELPDVPVGDHVPTVTPEHPMKGRRVVCESCGRSARLDSGDKQKRVLEELAALPCTARLTRVELVNLVFSPTAFTPPLTDLGIGSWYGRLGGGSHDEDIVRRFRHDRFQYTVYVRERPDGTYAASLSSSPSPAVEPTDELLFPESNPDNPATREAAIKFVTFLSATDPFTAGEFSELHAAYEDAYQAHRKQWLSDAYNEARGSFEDRFDDNPEAFIDAFPDSSADTKEVVRRMVGSDGFSDPPEPEFAAEILGHDHEFPGFIQFIADRHAWSPPVSETPVDQ